MIPLGLKFDLHSNKGHRGTEDVKTAVLFNHMKKVKAKKACHIMSNIDCLSICPSHVRMFHANIMWSGCVEHKG